ncbi:protein DpdF [Cupriavidus necator]|uniref:protein DpdF n=1 Tax=Cupriavidus necator TaxID=106590 RepID=UPI0009B81720|nr:protein DpdF [Cupriavidus necator]
MSGTSFGDAALRECLAKWSSAPRLLEARGASPLLERLRQVLSGYAATQPPRSHLALVSLIRQWMLLQSRMGGGDWLAIPTRPGWPDSKTWEGAGFRVAAFASHLDIQATKPRLAWLGGQSDLFDDAFDHIQALDQQSVPAEPFIADLLGSPSFKGAGQREAVRSLIHMPSDTTLIVALPTGNGKSLLAQLPPLLNGQGRLVLAIVPTVALAIDQGSRMAELISQLEPAWQAHALAFHGDLTSEERAEVFRRVHNGTQRLIFTSPEAATGSLRTLLEDCAKQGGLTHVVIDEAHLVATWGSGFRPAFQLLPALIARLRALTPHAIRVALASATITPHTLEVLQRQFGPAEKTTLISGVYLRPEPRYASHFCHTSAQKQQCVVDALKAAPRPFILYVTRPAEAEDWLRLLREEGFERIASFTGETPAHARKARLDQWKDNKLDGMIATSAFGLGVDKSDVRTIVHATLPESLDRFYQEVGRSGRDGVASASLLLYATEDIRQAMRMAGANYIGNVLGYERWTTMINQPIVQGAGSGEVWIDLHSLRPQLRIRGKSNLLWNLRTLTLMASAGLIEVTALSATRPDAFGKIEGDLKESDTAIAYAAVRIPNADHRVPSVFAAMMHEARAKARRASHQAFQLMMAIARNERSVDEALSTLYRLSLPNAWGPVRAYCGGCHSHWGTRPTGAAKVTPFVGRLPCFAVRPLSDTVLRALPRTLPNLSFVVVDDICQLLQAPRPGLLDALASRLRPHTIAVAHETPPELVRALRARLRRLQTDAFIDTFSEAAPDDLAGGKDEVRLIVWSAETVPQALHTVLQASECAMTVMIIPRTVRDPERPDRAWPSVLAHTDEESVLQALRT